MANIIKRVWNQNRMVQIEDLKGMTFQAEQAGHTFQISGIDDDGNTVALTGTPAGVLLRPDNTDVALTCSVSGGVVSATLPANCYDVPGRFGLTIFITSGSSKTAIYAAVGTVSRTSSGSVAPGTSQSVVDLINAINAAVNSIPASYSDLLADIAPTYSNSALYSVGQYARYDGDLKRCIVPITTAESYTADHWTSAVLGQDVSDLKSAINENTGVYPFEYSAKGKYIKTNGSTVDVTNIQTDSQGLFRYAVMSCAEGDTFVINGYGGESPRLWAFCNSNDEVISVSIANEYVDNYILIAPAGASYIVINDKDGKTSFKNLTIKIELEKIHLSEKYAFAGNNTAQTKTEYNDIVNVKYTGPILMDTFIANVTGNLQRTEGIITTSDYLPFGMAIIPLNGYVCALAEYAQDGTFRNRSDSFTSDIQFMNPKYKYKISLRRTATSTTISENEINNLVIVSPSTTAIKWGNGLIDKTTGDYSSNSTVLRTLSFLPESIQAIGMKKYDNRYALARYNKSTLAYVDRGDFGRSYTVLDHATYKYILLFNRTNDTVPSISETENIVFIENDTDNYFVFGVITSDGSISDISHGMFTPNFLPEDIDGITVKSCKYMISIVSYSKSTGILSERSSFANAPYYKFDHVNYRYRICVVTNDNTAIPVYDAKNIIQYHYSHDGKLPFAFSVGISDMAKYLSGDGTQVVIDNDRGMVYLLYNGGTSTYGEAYDHYDLAVFPIHQPFMVHYYDAFSVGQTYGNIVFVGGQDSNVILGNGFVRCIVYETGSQCFIYRDFDLSTKTFGDAYKVQLKTSAEDEAVDFTKANAKAYFDDNSIAFDGNPTLASRFFEKDNVLYGILLPTVNTSKPVFVKSTDSGETFEIIRIINITASIECAIAYTDKWYIVARDGAFYYSSDDFQTVARIGTTGCISCDATRPDMFVLDNDIVVCVSNDRTSKSSSLHVDVRTNVNMYKGRGTDIANYTTFKVLENPHGCTYYRIINYKGVLYYIGTCGELYPDKHYASPQCKDGIYYIKLGFADEMI